MITSPAAFAAAGPAGCLGDQLESPLGGPEIGHAQHQVGRQDADDRDIGKIMAFGDHLGTDQHIGLTPGELVQQPGMGGPADRRVLVHAQRLPERIPG